MTLCGKHDQIGQDTAGQEQTRHHRTETFDDELAQDCKRKENKLGANEVGNEEGQVGQMNQNNRQESTWPKETNMTGHVLTPDLTKTQTQHKTLTELCNCE